ncbi:MAG TPA: hypothetical protein VNG33_23450 [Polyangiaceae bacterium]|nr:hypothetical protein [Polyangiaceae bacterium]
MSEPSDNADGFVEPPVELAEPPQGEPSPPPQFAVAPMALPAANPFGSRLRPRPYLGPFLWTYGTLLWAYLVLGQYTTDHLPLTSPEVPLGGVTAALLFMLCSFTALGLSLRASRPIPTRFGPLFRGVAIFFLTLFAWWGTLLLSLGIGSSFRSNPDGPVTLTLFAFAVVSVALGRKLSRPHDWTRTPEQRRLVIAIWVAAVLLSLPALTQL